MSDSLPPFNPAPAYRLTRNPDEDWKVGDGLRAKTELGKKWVEDERVGWKTMNFQEIEKSSVYEFLISAVIPRPIAFVSTLSQDGIRNLAPYSYFNLVSHNPPLVSVSINPPSNGVKDSRENIKATKEFTVNIISESFVEAMNATSIDAPPEVDEFIVSGLTPIPSDVVKPPRLRESAISFECELFHFLDISPSGPGPLCGPNPTNTLVLGRIIRAHVRQAVLSADGFTVDPGALRAVSRLGGVKYARVGEGFGLARPNWKADGEAAKEVLEGKMNEMNLENGRL